MAKFMAHVNEPSASRPDPAGQINRLFRSEVGGVRAIPQKVEDQRGEAIKLRPGLGGNAGDIGAPGEREWTGLFRGWAPVRKRRLHAESQDREPPVQEPQRLNTKPEQVKCPSWMKGDVIEIRDVGRVHVAVWRVDVRVDSVQAFEHLRFGVNSNRCLHQRVVSAYFVEPEDVIDVGVGDEDSITTVQSMTQSLLAMIGGNVDEQGSGTSVGIDKTHRRTASKAGVPRISRRTGRTRTPDARDPRRGSRTEEFEPKVPDSTHG